MDLTKQFPCSPRVKMLGLVQLARATEKAKAAAAGTLGEYDYNCGMDRGVFEFLGIDSEAYLEVVRRARTDSEIEAYAKAFVDAKSADEIEAFNERFINYVPAPGSAALERFIANCNRIAPGRDDIRTPSDLLDFEEGRAALVGSVA